MVSNPFLVHICIFKALKQLQGSGRQLLLATLWLGANDAALPDGSK